MKVLLFSSLFPSSVRPVHGIFVETRLRELLKAGEISAKVVAPVPWFPFTSPRFGPYAQFAATPRMEHRNGLEVHHPRYALLPKVGMHLAPRAMAIGALPTMKRLQRDGFDFDLIDAHYYYPDGIAASLLARWLKKPFFVTARGSDINLIAEMLHPRRLIRTAAQAAAASIGVSQALSDRLVDIGAPVERVHTLRNGVDPDRFVPLPRDEARRQLGLPELGSYMLMVGNLVELKRHSIAITALVELPGTILLMVGVGPEEGALRALVQRLGLQDRVRFVGQVAQADLKWWYSAADVLLLCSSREGWPNVLLEAMACGTPVISTAVSGTPEIVSAPEAGVLMKVGDASELLQAWQNLQKQRPARSATRAHALKFSWDITSRRQVEIFRSIV